MTQDFTDFIADAAWLTRTGHADAAEDMIFEAWSVHAAHPGFESSTPGPRGAN